MTTTLTEKIKFTEGGVADRDDELRQATAVEVGAAPAVLREEFPKWVPSRILLGSLRDARLRLLEALNVEITVEDGHLVAEAVDLNEFGWGANMGDAIADLQRAVAGLYFQLEVDQARLGAGLQAVWATLRAKIRRA